MTAEIRETQRRYGSRAMVVAIIICLILILAGYKDIGKGLVLGTLFSIINFVLLGHMLYARIEKTGKQAMAFSLGSILFRYGLLSVPLILSIRFEHFHLIGAIVGVFMVQILIILDTVLKTVASGLGNRHKGRT